MSIWTTIEDVLFGTPAGQGTPGPSVPGINSDLFPGATNIFTSAADAVNSTVDFLKAIVWIFTPLHILRVVEFITGFTLMGWGIYLFTRPRHGQPSGHPLRELFARTPLGRAARVRQGRRMGMREGQREAARMEARRKETRGERIASAHERERINVSARTAARRQREGQARSRRVRES